jgi:hypothetical protein
MKAFVVLMALGLAALPAAAFAQIPGMPGGSLEFSAAGGPSVPFGDFNTFAEPGFGIGATGSMYVMPNIAVGASIAYNSYGMDESYGTSTDEADMTIWEFTGHAKYLFLPGPVTPYAKGALGIFTSKLTVEDPGLGTISTSVNDFGMGAGLGAQFRLPTSNLGFFGEGMAYMAMGDEENTTYYAIRGGINFYVSPKP